MKAVDAVQAAAQGHPARKSLRGDLSSLPAVVCSVNCTMLNKEKEEEKESDHFLSLLFSLSTNVLSAAPASQAQCQILRIQW